MKTLYLCGAGNAEGVRLAQTVNRRERRWDRLVLLDDDPARAGGALLGVPIEGPFDLLAAADLSASDASNMVARTTIRRHAARARIAAHDVRFASLIAPGVDTEGADFGTAVTVYENATVCPLAAVGDDSVVFMNAVVGHACRLGRGCVIAPGAVLNARVQLGDLVYVGSNATVLPEVTVGERVTIGAGSVVLEDVPPGATVFGVPAQPILAPGAGSAGGGRSPESAARSTADLEQALAQIWLEVLEASSLGVDVNFFDAGGTSLAALQVCGRIRERVRLDLALTDIFRFPTVRSLARHLASMTASRTAAGSLQHRAETRRQLHLRLAAER